VLDVSLLEIYLLFYGQMTIKKLVTLGSCLDFFASEKYKFCRCQAKRAETAN